MEMIKNSISWLEIPVVDFDRAKKFYSAIYDYEMPETMMDGYRMGFLLCDMENGGIGGAIVYGEGYEPSTKGVKAYLNGGSDLNTVLNRVENAGGKVMMKKTQITPEYGYYAMFEDSEGNHICLHSIE